MCQHFRFRPFQECFDLAERNRSVRRCPSLVQTTRIACSIARMFASDYEPIVSGDVVSLNAIIPGTVLAPPHGFSNPE